MEKINLITEEIDDDRKYLHISNSQVTTYMGCPYHYYLQKVKKLGTGSGSIFTVFGTAMHKTIQEYLRVMFGESVKKANTIDLPTLLKKSMIKECIKEEKKIKDSGKALIMSDDFRDIYYDGIEIINFFLKKRGKYFNTRKHELLSIEEELYIPTINGIKFKGFIDVVIKDKLTGRINLIDLKTSYSGWNDKKRKDVKVRMQLNLYKYFYSAKHNIPLDMIDTEFLILKRKVYDENCDWTIPRMQKFIPPSSERTIQKYLAICKDAIENIFTENGKYINDANKYPKQKSVDSCKYCEFKGTKHCDQ